MSLRHVYVITVSDCPRLPVPQAFLKQSNIAYMILGSTCICYDTRMAPKFTECVMHDKYLRWRHCLGIGVDDMFVIVQCYDQLKPHELQLPMHERMGLTMKHAGMSILVTSITDICAFAVGSSTVRRLALRRPADQLQCWSGELAISCRWSPYRDAAENIVEGFLCFNPFNPTILCFRDLYHKLLIHAVRNSKL